MYENYTKYTVCAYRKGCAAQAGMLCDILLLVHEIVGGSVGTGFGHTVFPDVVSNDGRDVLVSDSGCGVGIEKGREYKT